MSLVESALGVPCPVCRAETGAGCVLESGQPMGEPHPERAALMQEMEREVAMLLMRVKELRKVYGDKKHD